MRDMLHEAGSVLLDRYEIEAPIGQGGMGAVYRARDRVTGLIVAVKQLRTDAGAGFESHEMLARFEGEWQLLRTLNHPRIPRMLDAFRVGESGYYVMEFILGKSLDQVLKVYKSSGRRFPEELLMQYALQILDVLEYLHGLPKSLLHRDVKPQNIIVRDNDSELFLVDFGLAREGGSATTKTLVGTLGYAPLEQVKGHPEARSDLYALGATMWHILAGEQPAPFDIPPLATVRNDIHPALAEVVDRACQDNVNRRYANARKMELATRQALQALTGHGEDSQRYEELYLEEVPEVVYQGARPLEAKEFLLRAALASASFLLLMVVLYRVKHLMRSEPGVTPTALASSSESPDPTSLTPEKPGPKRPPPPPLDRMEGGRQITLSPIGPDMQGYFSMPVNWTASGYAGSIGPTLLSAPAGQPGALMLERGSAVGIRSLRLSLLRSQGPVNLQAGLWNQSNLVMGFTCTLERGSYFSTLTANGGVSELLSRPWEEGLAQTLELSYANNRWVLRDVEQGKEVALAGASPTVTNVQILVPPAVQPQHLGLNSISISEL